MIAVFNANDLDWISFPKLGLDLHISHVAFTLFGLPIPWYSILITVGMLLAMFYAFHRMPQFGVDSDRAIDGIIGGVIGAIIGARAYYVAFHWESYQGDLAAIFNIRKGGLAIYGGILGALLIGCIVCKLRKVRLLPMLDITGLGLLIGQCIGRWGNFTNQEAFGTCTTSPLGMTGGRIQQWLAQNAAANVNIEQPVHPCFLYESLWCLAGFVILHFVSKKRKFDGQIFLMYTLWYGAGRFVIEGLRTDSLYFGTIRVSQALALVSAAAALVLLLVGLSYVKRQGGDYKLYVDTAESKALLLESQQRETARESKKSKDNTADKDEAEVAAPAEEIPSDADAPQAEADEAPESPAEAAPIDPEKAAKDAKIDAILEELDKAN